MKISNLTATALAVIVLASCGDSTAPPDTTLPMTPKSEVPHNGDIIKMTIASKRADCTGVTKMQCMLVKREGQQDWEYFYSGINGFDYQEGYEYVLEVKTEKVANPPADAPGIIYTLVKEVSKEQKASAGLPVK